MDLSSQLILIFSAFGSLNGLFLVLYFINKARTSKKKEYYILAALFLTISLRIIKSIFFFFNGDISATFVEFGIINCALIGPLLYLFLKISSSKDKKLSKLDSLHIVPYVIAISYFSLKYDYFENRLLWVSLVKIINKQWALYLLLSLFILIRNLKKDNNTIKKDTLWFFNLWAGVAVIWFGFEFFEYTSYIIGAISFTFIFYISVFYWVILSPNRIVFKQDPKRYENSALTDRDVEQLFTSLEQLMGIRKPFLDPELSLESLSNMLEINQKILSQVINQSCNQNYSQYVAQKRVDYFKLLTKQKKNNHYTIAALAFESGFNSISSFNENFKKLTGITASRYRETVLKSNF